MSHRYNAARLSLACLTLTLSANAASIQATVITGVLPGNINATYDSTTGLASTIDPGAGALSSSGGNVLNLTNYLLGASGASGTTVFGSYLADALASVSLNTGKIGTFVDSGVAFSSANADGRMFDSLTFNNTTASVQAILVNLSVDGIITLGTATGFLAHTQAGFGSGGFLFDTNQPVASTASGWASFTISPVGPGHAGALFSGTYLLAPGSTIVPFFMISTLNINGGSGTVDFSHTSAVGLSLPAGVTFTSESGVFLTDTGSTVPEPSTLILLGLGLLSIALPQRRRAISVKPQRR